MKRTKPSGTDDITDWSQDNQRESIWENKSVCFPCGNPYLSPKQKKEGGAVTAHTGECCLCGKTKMVTDTRYFNYLRVQFKNDDDPSDNRSF